MEPLTGRLRHYARVPISAQPTDGSQPTFKLAPDIQAILSILLHQDTQHKSSGAVLDLRDTDLSCTGLRGKFLLDAILHGSDLRHARLNKADLRSTYGLPGRRLQRCTPRRRNPALD